MSTRTGLNTKSSLNDTLRQMVAVLQDERQALAGLDLDAIMGAAVEKQQVTRDLEKVGERLATCPRRRSFVNECPVRLAISVNSTLSLGSSPRWRMTAAARSCVVMGAVASRSVCNRKR